MTTSNPDTDRPLRGRRLSAAEFERLTGKTLRQADNDNNKEEKHEAA